MTGPQVVRPVTIRTATPADVAAIASLEESALGVDAWSSGLIAEGVAGSLPTISYLVAELAGAGTTTLTGFAVASVVAEIAELQRIAVTDEARRSGVGSALLTEIVGRARADRADRLLLEVRETNAAALAFYARHGFVEIDRRPRYYRDGSTAIVLRRGLGAGCGGS